MYGYILTTSKREQAKQESLRHIQNRGIETVQSALSQAQKSKNNSSNYWYTKAFSLQNFYMGVQRIFEDIAKEVQNSLPTGRNITVIRG